MKNKNEFRKQLITKLIQHNCITTYDGTLDNVLGYDSVMLLKSDLLEFINSSKVPSEEEISNTYYLHTNDGVTIYLQDEILLFSTDGFSKHGSHIVFYFKYKYLSDSKGYVDTNKVSYMIKSLQLAIKENYQFLSDEERKTWDHYYYYTYSSPKSNLKKRKNANGIYHVNLKGVSKKPKFNDNPVAKFEIHDVLHSKHWWTEAEIDIYPYFRQVIKSINDTHFCN